MGFCRTPATLRLVLLCHLSFTAVNALHVKPPSSSSPAPPSPPLLLETAMRAARPPQWLDGSPVYLHAPGRARWRLSFADSHGDKVSLSRPLTALSHACPSAVVSPRLQVLLKPQWLMVVISILVVACVLCAEALARARVAPKPDSGRSQCAQEQASAASPRQQKTSVPQLGRAAAAQLRPVLMLCLVSATSAVRLATNVACLPYEANEVFLDLSGARATAFPKGIPQADALGRLWRRLDLAAQQLGRAGWARLQY